MDTITATRTRKLPLATPTDLGVDTTREVSAALQPLSVEGGTGLNLAVGVTSLKLRQTP